MVRQTTMHPGLFILFQLLLIVVTGYLFSHITMSMQSLLWLIFTSVTWMGLLVVSILSTGVGRAVELLNDISKKSV